MTDRYLAAANHPKSPPNRRCRWLVVYGDYAAFDSSPPAIIVVAKTDFLIVAHQQNPTEHGFGTELWTLKRVGAVIERMYGVRFSQTQVWRILGSLGFSPQKPEKRAIERNEDAVRSWKRRTWPALKKKPNGKAD